jgi:hypothetical protein
MANGAHPHPQPQPKPEAAKPTGNEKEPTSQPSPKR